MKARISTIFLTSIGWLLASPAIAQVNTSIAVTGYGDNSPETIVINLLNWVLGIMALLVVAMLVIGGFRWMTAAGNEEKTSSAIGVMSSAVIGLILIFAAWGIALYAVGILASATNASTI